MTILVRHAMTDSPATASPEMNAADAAALMKQYDVGAIPVTRGSELLGLVTDRDLVLRVLAERQDPTRVLLESILTRTPVTVSPDPRISDARDLMAERRIRRLPVVKNEELVGMISLGDIAIADASERAVGETLEEISESHSTTDANEDVPRGTPERILEQRRGS